MYALKIWTQAVQHNNLTLNDIIYARKQMATHLRTYTHILTHIYTQIMLRPADRKTILYMKGL